MQQASKQTWAFDCEWAPDLTAGRRLYHLGTDVPDDEVLRVMWEQGGATEENPQPFLKTVLNGCVAWARENNVTLITDEHVKIINDKRRQEKEKR